MRNFIAGLAAVVVTVFAISTGASAAPPYYPHNDRRGERAEHGHDGYYHDRHHHDHRRWEHNRRYRY